MLINRQNQVVNLPKNLNSREHPAVFIPLREVKEPSQGNHDKMFRLETRARIIN